MISIITPTHKPCVLLDLTIKSVLTQTYDDFEWVVLDNSQECYFETYLNDFFIKNPHLEYRRDKIKLHHKVCEGYNIGQLKNECVGLTNCGEDEYVLLLDHDDFLNPRLLEYVHDLECRYPLAQFINGDNVTLEYDIQNEIFGWYCWKAGLYYEDLLKDESLIKWVSRDVNINIDDVNINFGYCTEYTLRYFDYYPVSTTMMEALKEDIGSPLHFRIACHPRIIKKHVLKNKYFAF
jgi:glycosyltransferase involved in cell wall biosynthesis